MQIVIKIKEEDYIDIMASQFLPKFIKDAIKNGTALPEQHGDLVDRDAFWDAYHDLDYDFYEAYDSVPTILEGTVKE